MDSKLQDIISLVEETSTDLEHTKDCLAAANDEIYSLELALRIVKDALIIAQERVEFLEAKKD